MIAASLFAWTLASAAWAGDPSVEEGRARQLSQQMERLAARNAWDGVDRAWVELHALNVSVRFEDEWLGAEAARMRGDAWGGYQRTLAALRLQPQAEAPLRQLEDYRSSYGRLTVRRVDDTSIDLVPTLPPIAPDQRGAVEWASKLLHEAGAFDGLLPVGEYRVGPYAIAIEAGLTPVVVQRVLGDGAGGGTKR